MVKRSSPRPTRSHGGAPGFTSRHAGTLNRWFGDRLLRQVFGNAGILLSGESVGALFRLGTLALTARELGPELFGVLVLVQTYVQMVGGLVKFQSWQAVIRYGAVCLEAGRREAFQGLIKFTTLLDAGSAVLGAAIAVAAAPVVGQWLGWTDATVSLAMLYGLTILFTLTATSSGVLRLFDRFGLLAKQAAVAPMLEFAAVGIAYLAGAGLDGFLVALLVAGILGRLILPVMGWRELSRRGLLAGMTSTLKGVTLPHPGLWRFVWSTNLNTSVGLAAKRADTLIVGWIIGPSGAGVYKIAREFADALAKPVTRLRQTIYPTFARLLANREAKATQRLMLRSGLIAGAAAALVVLGVAIAGRPFIELIVGEAYRNAYGVLILLVLARTISVFAFPLAPALTALGRPGTLLGINVVLVLIYLPVLILALDRLGLPGAGVAAVALAAMTFASQIAVALRRLSRRHLVPEA